MQNIFNREPTNQELMCKLFAYWKLQSLNPNKEDPLELSLSKDNSMHEILSKRVEKYGMKISPYFSTIMILGMNGNPGLSIVYLYEILKKHVEKYGKIKRNYILTCNDFSNVFTYGFPDYNDPDEMIKYENLWDSQKDENGHNKVDKPEYWDILFE